MKDDYTTNSHYLTYTFLFKRLGECTFWTYGSERERTLSIKIKTTHTQKRGERMPQFLPNFKHVSFSDIPHHFSSRNLRLGRLLPIGRRIKVPGHTADSLNQSDASVLAPELYVRPHIRPAQERTSQRSFKISARHQVMPLELDAWWAPRPYPEVPGQGRMFRLSALLPPRSLQSQGPTSGVRHSNGSRSMGTHREEIANCVFVRSLSC